MQSPHDGFDAIPANRYADAMNEEANLPEPMFEVSLPTDQEAGVYANFLTVWHSEHEFTLDFSVTQLPRVEQENGEPPTAVTIPCTVVSRVKIPPSLIFEVLRALNVNMANYEQNFGSLHALSNEGQNADGETKS